MSLKKKNIHNQKNIKKKIKKEKKENCINCGGHEPNTLSKNKYSNHTREKNKLLNKKRKREIKIDEKPKKLSKIENLESSFGKSFSQFDTGDDARYKYKGIKKKVKNSRTENSKTKSDFYQEELIQSEHIYLSIRIYFINIIPNVNDSSDEELNFDIIRNISSNHQGNNIIYNQNLIMNHNYSLSYISTNETTIQF